MMLFTPLKRSLATHDGAFHADEVTACALLLTFDLIDRDKIIRSRDQNLLEQYEYVCDVGGIYDPASKHFDHHQAEYQGNMSSAGMVWLYLKEQGKVDEAFYYFLHHSLIGGVDAHDNGKINIPLGICTFSQVISNFMPYEQDAEEEILYQSFLEAVDFATHYVQRALGRYRYIRSFRDEVRKEMSKGHPFLVFEKPIPWMDIFFELGGECHPALFVIMPAKSYWKLRGIPPNGEERMKVRLPLPNAWAGLQGETLKRVSKIPGAIFCHKGKFISFWETREDAFKALKVLLG